MKTKFLATLFLILTINASFGSDKLQRAFERLKIYDYFLAKEYFLESLKSKEAGASYGLSLIYSSKFNPFYQLDSARKYILIAEKSFKPKSEKENKYYSNLGITVAAIQLQKDSICIKAFNDAEIISTVKSYDLFISNFNFCKQTGHAQTLLNSAAYRDAVKANSSLAFKQFMTSYPNANEFRDAENHYQEKLFEETTADGKIESYVDFLQKYPESPFKTKAEKTIYNLSVKDKSIPEYTSFIRTYPQNKFVTEAWRELYKLYMNDYNDQTLVNFKTEFPDYPFMSELESDYTKQRAYYSPIKKDNKWGFIDEQGEIAIKPEYDEVNFFSENLAVAAKNGKYGYINKSGQTIIAFEYDEAESFINNMAVVAKDGKSGLINKHGELLIPMQYDELADPVEDICVATLNEKSGYVTTDNKKLTELIYDIANDFQDDYALIQIDEHYGLINQKGIVVIEPKYDELFYLTTNIFRANNQDKWGLISNLGQIILPIEYDEIGEMNSNRALIAAKNKFGYINNKGEIVIPITYKYNGAISQKAAFFNYYTMFMQAGKPILIDTSGNKVLLNSFEDVGIPSEGLVAVRKGKKWGYADLNGKIQIPFIYESAGRFESGFAKVKIKNHLGLIDSTGKFMIEPEWEKIIRKNKAFVVSINNLLGLTDINGALLLTVIYNRIEFLSDNIIMAIKNDKRTYYNFSKRRIIWSEPE